MENSNDRCINTLEDVVNFAEYLYYEKSLEFHPEDDFAEYVDLETNEPAFSAEEAEILNCIMDECFEVCEENGKDICEVMADFIRKED